MMLELSDCEYHLMLIIVQELVMQWPVAEGAAKHDHKNHMGEERSARLANINLYLSWCPV